VARVLGGALVGAASFRDPAATGHEQPAGAGVDDGDERAHLVVQEARQLEQLRGRPGAHRVVPGRRGTSVRRPQLREEPVDRGIGIGGGQARADNGIRVPVGSARVVPAQAIGVVKLVPARRGEQPPGGDEVTCDDGAAVVGPVRHR